MNPKPFPYALTILFLLSTLILHAQSDSAVDKPLSYVTKHSIRIDNKVINYTATVGTLILRNAKDEPTAAFGYIAYVRDFAKGEEAESARRPVTFCYNGGPGSSSIWLHMGVIGPRRVVVNDPGFNGPPPYKLEDNNYSILDVSDIVMMDPIGTGLSHATGKAKNKDFWGVDEDIRSVSQFIKQYITDHEKWNAPKYILGESYGTFRSAGVADYLHSNMGISLNGVVLVSSVLDIRTLSFQPYDDLPYIVNLPTYAATSWYHNKVPDKPANLEAFLKDVRSFASGEYAAALMKGDNLDAAEKERVLIRLVACTGIRKDYWEKANLRIMQPQFAQELLRDEHEAVGRLDSRYKGISKDLLGEYSFSDPQDYAISPAFTATFMNYFTTELNVDKNRSYRVSAYGLEGFDWDWKHARSQGLFGDASTPNTAPDLVNALIENPQLKVLVLNGIFDMATPFYGTEFTFDHLGLEKQLKNNITMKYYEAGHMMYIHNESAARFKKDVSEFITNTLKRSF